jgi:zinc transport system ATP-binding protein
MNPVVEIRQVSFSYGGNLVLEEVSLSVEKGDFLALVGPNGAGKTTLLKLVLGLLDPLCGQIELFGAPIGQFKQWYRLGYIPQKATNFDRRFPATVEEVVMAGRFGRLGLGARPGKHDQLIVEEALEAVGMMVYRKHLLSSLSGGQQQRVFIARALAGQPELLILDEPVVGLDSRALESFYRLLDVFNRQKGITLIIVSHDTGVVARWVNKVACINHTLLYHGHPEQVLSADNLSMLYGAPVHLVTHEH